MKILVTGFKPFLGEKLNPSQILAEGCGAEFLILPVEFGASFELLKSKLAGGAYDYLLMLGQAAGRSKVSLEKIALNWVQTEHRDESGQAPEAGRSPGRPSWR